MRVLLTTILALMALLASPGGAAAQQTPFAPVAVVNGDAITGYDVEQRMRLLAALAKNKPDPAGLQSAAFEGLIEDRLKLQEGRRLGIELTDDLLATGIDGLARQRGESVEELAQRFERAGVSKGAVRDSVGAEVVWLEVVRGRFLSRVDPGDVEIEAELGLIAQGGSNVSYRLQEIGLPNPPGGSAEAEARALYEQLSKGGDFTAAVRRHSRAPSAQNEGRLGWVEANRLPSELGRAVAALEPGQLAPPFPVAAGWSIVKLLESRRDETAPAPEIDAETRERLRNRMIDQRVSRLADGLLQDLQRSALIERR